MFVKNDQGFICKNCGFKVVPLMITSRNHCPKCLYSLHVDINPGDRKNRCNGLMKPISIETSSKKGYIIIFKCLKCGISKKNKAVNDAINQPDDIDEIIRVSVKDK